MEISQGGVWLDARGTQSVAHGERGIARYIAEQIHALLETAPGTIGAIGLDPELPVPESLQSLADSGLIADQTGTPERLPEIYHVMSPFESALELNEVWPVWARGAGCRTVVTLYDLIPLVMRDHYIDSAWGVWGAIWMARLGLIRAADQVLTISRRTADDAIEHLGIGEGKITVIESGVSDSLSSLVDSPADAGKALKGIRRLRPGFLLYVGGDDPRKNLEGVIRGYGLLPESVREAHQLVIVCRLTFLRRRQLMAHARSLGVRRRDVLLPGFVSSRELAALYAGCGLFVFPSLYEGAGLPILEAMSCGAPVAASRTSSIPEILGDADATFDPADPKDIARCLREVLTDDAQLAALRQRSAERVGLFTWTRVAERTLEGYERGLESSRSRTAA